jgi:hypothetical protein
VILAVMLMRGKPIPAVVFSPGTKRHHGPGTARVRHRAPLPSAARGHIVVGTDQLGNGVCVGKSDADGMLAFLTATGAAQLGCKIRALETEAAIAALTERDRRTVLVFANLSDNQQARMSRHAFGRRLAP